MIFNKTACFGHVQKMDQNRLKEEEDKKSGIVGIRETINDQDLQKDQCLDRRTWRLGS